MRNKNNAEARVEKNSKGIEWRTEREANERKNDTFLKDFVENTKPY